MVTPAPLLQHTLNLCSPKMPPSLVPLITTAEWGGTAQARTKLLLLMAAFAHEAHHPGRFSRARAPLAVTIIRTVWRAEGRNLRNATIDPGWEPNAGRSFRKEKVDTSYREHRSWGVGDVEFQGMLGWGTALHPYRGTSVPLRIWCLLHAIRIP